MKTRIKLGFAVVLAVLTGLPASAGQTTALHQVMRNKLQYSQHILEAVVTGNWVMLERESRSLLRVTDDPAWAVLRTPDYVRQSEAFLRATQDLVDAARSRDVEASSLGYVALTMSCVQCHRYVQRSRIAAGRD